MSRLVFASRWREPLVFGTASRVAIAVAGLVAAVTSTAIFVGPDGLADALPMAMGAAIIAMVYRVLEPGGPVALWRRIAAMLSLFLLMIVALMAFTNHVEAAGGLTARGAALVSLPFCVFMALAGSGMFELTFLLMVCGMTYIAGIWRTPQGPEFVPLLVTGVGAGILALALALIRHDVLRYRRRGRDRLALGLEPPKIRGNYPLGSWIVVIILLIASSLVLAAALFVALPRPGAPVADTPEDNVTETNDPPPPDPITPGPANPDAGTPGGGEGTAGSGIGLTDSVDNDRVGRLLKTPTPMYRVTVERDGGVTEFPGRHMYLRGMVLDYFDGRRWSVSPIADGVWEPVRNRDGVLTPLGSSILSDRLPSLPQARVLMERLSLRQSQGVGRHGFRVRIEPFADNTDRVLPLPDLPLRVSLRTVEYNRNLALMNRVEAAGRRGPEYNPSAPYTVECLNFRERDTQSLVAGGETNSWAGDSCRQIPPGLSPRFARLAAELIADSYNYIGRPATTAFDKVQLVMAYLSPDHGYTYTLDLPPIPRGMSGLENFLFETRRGHCELFASSAALLLRYMRVSTRVVGGYMGGNWDDMEGTYEVRGAHAHLWFEVLFQGYGWFPFDPTPSATRDDLVDRVNDGEILPGPDDDRGIRGDEDAGAAETTPERQPDPPDVTEADTEEQTPPGATRTNAVASFSVGSQRQLWNRMEEFLAVAVAILAHPAMMVLLAFALASLIVVAMRRRVRRTERRRREGRGDIREVDPSVRVSWYEQLLDLLDRVGMPRRPSETPGEFAIKVRNRLGPVGDSFCLLTDWYQVLRYGGLRLPADDQSRLQSMRVEFVQALQRWHTEQAAARAAASGRHPVA